jgi:hypothetical protein
MATQPNEPAMHCTAEEPVQVNILAGRVLNDGVFANTTLFPNPPVDKADFEAASDKLDLLIGQAKGDSKATKNRNAQSVIVYNYLAKLRLYVKMIADGDVTIINASGFDLNYQPVKMVAPEMPVVKKVLEGKVAGTYKVILSKHNLKLLLAKKAGNPNRGARFTVQTSLTPTTEASWTTVLENEASTKLLINGLTSGAKIYIRVFASNKAGKSPVSAAFPFIPQ